MLTKNAYAKINWSLDITGLRGDGYHLVDMLMQSISLYDILTVEKHETLTLSIEGNLPFSQDNLILKAARLLKEETGYSSGAAFHLKKQIPVSAGLGGGSADAACALHLLNELWGLSLSEEKLFNLGAKLGADIPFLLKGGLAHCTGIGTELNFLPFAPKYHLVLVQPKSNGLSTREVYAAYDALPKEKAFTPNQEALLTLLKKERSDLSLLQNAMGNVLTPAAMHLDKELQKCLADFSACGAVCFSMTGSGSVVYSVHQRQEEAEKLAKLLTQKGYKDVFLARTAV